MQNFTVIQLIAVGAIPVLFAITIHEVAHGFIAKRLGDRTAEQMGRLTLNPINHIDPIGTLLVPAILVLLKVPFIFGWAKPVPVNYNNLNNPKRDTALVALGGPLSNFVMALFWGLIMKLSTLVGAGTQSGLGVYLMGQIGVIVNLVLMVLNLIPLPPLDGSKVLASLLSQSAAEKFYRLEPYGFFVLVGLLLLGILQRILFPPLVMLYYLIMGLYGLPTPF